MSWTGYIDKLIATGGCDAGAIVGLNGAVWGQKGLKVTKKEGKIIAGAFLKAETVQGKGFTVAGREQFTLRADDECLMGKDKKDGKKGVCCYKSVKAIVVGSYNDKMSPGNCAKAAGEIADFLKKKGY